MNMNHNLIFQFVLAILLLFAETGSARPTGDDSANEVLFFSNTRQLIYEGQRSGEGYFSDDGKAMIFQSERESDNPFFQIYVLDLESGDSRRVSTGLGKTTCAFFQPGSDRILFASSHLDPEVRLTQKAEFDARASGKQRRYSWDYDPFMEIFSTTRKGTDLKQLTDVKGYDAEASYSPDGSRIVFCSLRDAYDTTLPEKERKLLEVDQSYFGEIYVMNADGSNQTRLTAWPGYDGGPFFSPDGSRIIWRHFKEDGALADVYTMRIDGSDRRRITDFVAMSWAPYYHPSGNYILFAANKLGFANFEIYMVDSEGTREPVRVTSSDGFDGLPVFSSDGSKISWTSNRTADKKSQIFLADWNHLAALAALAGAPMRAAGNLSAAHEDSDDGGSTAKTAVREADATEFSPKILSADLKRHASFLASDELEGRMSGGNGTKQAADFIIKRFRQAGLEPLGDNGTFLQAFEFTSGIKIKTEENAMQLTSNDSASQFEVETDFRPLPFTTDGVVEGEVVFAGYGLAVPGEREEGVDSYANLDVKDKIVLVLRYVPEAVDVERRQKLNLYAGLRYKAHIARERGAKAVLVVSGPNSPNAGKLVPLRFDNSSASSGIVAASISGKVAEQLLAGSDKSLAELQTGLDDENPHFTGTLALAGTHVKIQAGVERIKKTDNNVVGVLRASDGVSEAVLIGAHYDHIGYGEVGSLARKGEEGQIHNGADDNASGTSTVLELAAALGELKRTGSTFRRDIVFCLWSGEELGIIGSSAFVAQPPIALDKMSAYLNFDMVGRLRDNKLILQGVGSSSLWRKVIERRNVAAGFNLVIQDDPYQPTDITAFYPKGVPVLSFFTGSHDNYNRPTDDAQTLDYVGMERISKFAHAIIRDLATRKESPDYLKVERVRNKGGNRDAMRAYLGTIPDYVSDGTEGVKLSGVSAGGPADKAGLQSGDLIVKLAGQDITNIYDYTFAIDAVKIGEATEVVVMRNGEKVTLSIVPEARN